jgi:L-lysine exporter family protein LysE/ArgO
LSFSVFLAGNATLLSLIVAIGAQNAFVLRQGLRDEHVLVVVMICALSDTILITLGVTSFGKIALRAPWIDPVMRYGGACFLAWYGAKSLNSALYSTLALTPKGATKRIRFMPVVLACLALTWLNPHVYLDTVVMIGVISTQFPGSEASFAAGAISGSFLFFFSLGYGATWLRPIFERPSAWRTLDATIALVMWSISFKLVASL